MLNVFYNVFYYHYLFPETLTNYHTVSAINSAYTFGIRDQKYLLSREVALLGLKLFFVTINILLHACELIFKLYFHPNRGTSKACTVNVSK